MKHCLIITAYKDLPMLNRLIAATPADWGVFVHLDRKSPLRAGDVDSRAHVFRWRKIHWGAPAHLQVIIRLMRTAFEAGDWDYFHIVSGQDFYAVPPARFDEVLGTEGKNYIKCRPLPIKGLPWGEGLDIFRCRSLCSWVDVRRRFWARTDKLLFKVQNRCGLVRKLPALALYKGLVYSSLHRSFVGWVLSSDTAAGLLRRLRHSIVPEEVYFHTLVMNSPYKDSVENRHLRFDDWSGPVKPATLDASYADAVVRSGALFCRKVETGTSDELIRRLETVISD